MPYAKGKRPFSPPMPARLTSDSAFRLLLYLEWILLGLVLLGKLRPSPHLDRGGWDLLASVSIVIVFGLMGLWLPQRLISKLLYTAAEFGLLLLAFWLDRRAVFLPLPGLVIVIRSCLLFSQPGRLIVAGSVFAVFWLRLMQLPPPHRRGPLPPDGSEQTLLILQLNAALTFGLTLLFTLLLVNTLLAERQSRERLQQANAQLRQYALRIEDQATLQERNRIAREIHDALGHALTAQSIQLENAQLFLPAGADKTAAFLSEAKQLGTEALQDVRRSLSTLRANPLQGQPLTSAIAKTLQEFHQTTGIALKTELGAAQPLSVDLATAVYRILQESLTNIARHSQATEVRVTLLYQPHQLQLQIEDNGQGFEPAQNTSGFGLQGMRERAAALGGELSLDSRPGQGCRLQVQLPLPRRML